jgi:2'-5' RNA ligase
LNLEGLAEQSMIRAFIAAKIEDAVLERIAQATEALRSKLHDVRWIPMANWHLTFKFLGSVDEARVEEIGAALERKLNLFPRCTISVKGLGIFPDVQRPRVLWAGVEGRDLAALAEGVENALAPLGFEREQRAFKPHLTIGRWREGKRAGPELERELAAWRWFDFGRSGIVSVELFQSILKRSGAEYCKLKTVPLEQQNG